MFFTTATQTKPKGFRIHFSRSMATNTSLINCEQLVICSPKIEYLESVAIRCDSPLDAVELNERGYPLGFFERDNNVSKGSFSTIRRIGIRKIAYFCDISGPQFDLNKMVKLAGHYNIKLYRVVLPFPAFGLALWDEWQWRIFDTRLSRVLNDMRSIPKPTNLLTGGENNAPIH